MAGSTREARVDVIGRDRASAAFKSAAKGAEDANAKIKNLKDGFGKAVGPALALGAAVAVASRMLDRGLAQSLSRATAQVALGEKGYAALSAAAEKNAHVLGLSRAEFIASAGQTARLTKNLGFSQQEAAKFGSTMPDLAAKLSMLSAGTTSAAEASDMMSSALAGEFDPLQRLGIAISAARVEQEAATISKREGGRVTTEQAKALAVLEIVQRQTTDASKVATTEAGKQARKVAEAKAQIKEFADSITAAALPALASFTGALNDNVKATTEADGILGKLGGAARTAGTGWEVYWNWLGKVTGETDNQTAAAEQQAPALDAAAQAANDAKVAQDKLYSQLQRTTEAQIKQSEVMFGTRDAARDYEAAIDAAAAAVRENGRTLDITTPKGRANEAALDDIAKAALRQREAMLKAAASGPQLDAALASSRAALQAAGERFGMTTPRAKAYADQILGIPKAVATTVSLSTGDAMQKLDTLIQRIALVNGKIVRLQVAANSANVREGRSASFGDGGSSWVEFAAGAGWSPSSGRSSPPVVNNAVRVFIDGDEVRSIVHEEVDVAMASMAWQDATGGRL